MLSVELYCFRITFTLKRTSKNDMIRIRGKPNCPVILRMVFKRLTNGLVIIIYLTVPFNLPT